MRGVLKQLVLKRGFEVAEAGRGGHARSPDLAPVLADRDADILGEALGKLARNVPLLAGRLVAGARPGDRRQRQFVGHAGVVDRQCRGKKSCADKAVRDAQLEGVKLMPFSLEDRLTTSRFMDRVEDGLFSSMAEEVKKLKSKMKSSGLE